MLIVGTSLWWFYLPTLFNPSLLHAPRPDRRGWKEGERGEMRGHQMEGQSEGGGVGRGGREIDLIFVSILEMQKSRWQMSPVMSGCLHSAASHYGGL